MGLPPFGLYADKFSYENRYDENQKNHKNEDTY